VAGLPGDWCEAGETCRLARIEGADLGHFNEQARVSILIQLCPA
jgi:hypothetical protein